MEEARAAGQLSPRRSVQTHPSPLVVDETGYLPINHTGAVLFFQLTNRRYEHTDLYRELQSDVENSAEVVRLPRPSKAE